MNLRGSSRSMVFLENLIAGRDLQMFVCEDAQDEKRIHEEAKRRNWQLNSTVVAEERAKSVVCPQMPDNLQRLGFFAFAADLFTAPKAVKIYLCNIGNLTKIPIGSDQTDVFVDQGKVTESIKDQFPLFLTDSRRVQIGTSRYSHQTTTRMDSLRPTCYWLVAHRDSSLNSGRLKTIVSNFNLEIDQIERKICGLREQQIGIGKRREEIRQTVKTITCKLARKQQIVSEISIKTTRMTYLTHNKPDLKSAELTMVGKVNQLVKKSSDIADRVAQVIEKMDKHSVRFNKEVINFDFINVKIRLKRLHFVQIQENYRQNNEELTRKEGDLSSSKDHMHSILVKIRDKCGLSTLDQDRMNSAERHQFDSMFDDFNKAELPLELTDLNLLLAQETGRLKAIGCDSQEEVRVLTLRIDHYFPLISLFRDIHKYERLQKELVEKDRQMGALMEKNADWNRRMDEQLADWLVPLKELVEKISDNFSDYFERLCCVGEVRLCSGNDPRAISEYGLEIMVKFRDSEQLRRLTAFVQSGGERSVSTILYLIAIQELCPVPFCCVDEINQGMDPTNERRVFEMLVEMLAGNRGNVSNTQYLMLTPKLLNNLPCSDKLNVLIVNNGPALADNMVWDLDKFQSLM